MKIKKYSEDFIYWINAKAQEAHEVYKAHLIKHHIDSITHSNMKFHDEGIFDKVVEHAKELAKKDIDKTILSNNEYSHAGDSLIKYWNEHFNHKFEHEFHDQTNFEQILLLSKKLNNVDLKDWMEHYAQFLAKLSLVELKIIKNVYPKYDKWSEKYNLENVFDGTPIIEVDISNEESFEDATLEPVDENKDVQDFSKMTVKQLREYLEAEKIQYKKSAKKSELLKLV